MKTRKLVYALLFTTVLFVFSCSKEGPAGPQGEQGVAGPTGATGAKGDKGDKGTANVIYSDWMSINWTTDLPNLKTARIYTIPNHDIYKTGLIMVYKKYESGGTKSIEALPCLYYSGTLDNFITSAVKFYVYGNGLYLKIRSFHGRTISEGLYQGPEAQYRYVLVPGGVPARKSSATPKMTDYHAVCEYYGIPE